MRSSIARYVGWAGIRPGLGPPASKILRPPCIRFESTLNLPELDRKWRSRWKKEQEVGKRSATAKLGAEKKYILPMFPYPSGDLHLGHLRVYTISDVLSRFRRMQGYDVMHPIGWDAFGLPAENAAIERGIDPKVWTKQNIAKMKTQLEAMNGHWDWDREFATCDPSFYKHTQALFLALHKAGLAYQAESLVNYDPVDKTVLANEQVDANGRSWRSGAVVEKKMLKQWFFKISEFRQELLDGLTNLEKNGAWPERVLAMQKNWLGKSKGAKIKFPVVAYSGDAHAYIEVFTTRPDTIFGVQYLALASTHPIVQSLAKSDIELQAFLDTIPALPPDSKVGYLLPHVRALNPLASEDSAPDASKASLPIYVAPYVLGDYGDGAVMGVPGHDTRDHSFWKHNRYDDLIRLVISQSADEATTAMKAEPLKQSLDAPFIHHGVLTHHSGRYEGMTTAEATEEILNFLELKDLGSTAETWRLRDWLISRQRYWGTPIPVIHCESCGPVPVPDDQLPVELPSVDEHWESGKTGNPLEHAHDWVNTSCPSCGGVAKRDTDTMDTFVDSSWYFMRFTDPKNAISPFSPEAADAKLPVDLYIGGVEHAILHLLYARFISKFLASSPAWPKGEGCHGEPFTQVLTQGMVHGKTYSDPDTGRFLKPDEVDLSDASNPRILPTGQNANVSFEKMSKSKYNGVDPGTCMTKYGADATRAHILFQAPVSEILEWDEDRISGIIRWLRRVHEMVLQTHERFYKHPNIPDFNPKAYFIEEEIWSDDAEPWHRDSFFERKALKQDMPLERSAHLSTPDIEPSILKSIWEAEKGMWRDVQRTIESVTHSYSTTYSLNTVVSDLMSLTNVLGVQLGQEYTSFPMKRWDITPVKFVHHPNPMLSFQAMETLLRMMAPITPAFAEECWTILHSGPRSEISDSGIFRPGSPRSIFDESFPTTDGTYELLAPATHSCAVQVNGRLRFIVQIPVTASKLEGEELKSFVIDEVLRSEDGKEKLSGPKDGKNYPDASKAKKVIVVRAGTTINFVI